MSRQNILLIEPELGFLQKLSKTLKDLGYTVFLRTDIKDPEEVLDSETPFHLIIMNLELPSIEGLTLYSYIKNTKKFKNSTFIFLAEDENIFHLIENMPLERSVVLNKRDDFEELVRNILEQIPFTSIGSSDGNYWSDVHDSFEKVSFKQLIAYCKKSLFNGNILIVNGKEQGKIAMDNGELVKANLNDLSSSDAILRFNSWTKGEFTLERKRLTSEYIRSIVDENPQSNGADKYTIDLNDMLIDLFYFLHQFLCQQMEETIVSGIFDAEIEQFNKESSNLILLTYRPESDEKIICHKQIEKTDLSDFFQLIKRIFHQAKLSQPEIEITDFFDYMNEIEPYLKQIGFYNFFSFKEEQDRNLVGRNYLPLTDHHTKFESN